MAEGSPLALYGGSNDGRDPRSGLGPADGPVKNAILGANNARLYHYDKRAIAALATDRVAAARERYEQLGAGRSNLRFGYVLKPRA